MSREPPNPAPPSPATPETPPGKAARSAGLTPEQQAALRKAEHAADIVRDAVFPASLADAIPVGDEVSASGFKVYRDHLLQEAGDPSDPIEKMLIEQLSMAHYRIMRLHIQAEQCHQFPGVAVYAAAATRLTGEFRRLALAIRHYREPLRTPSFTVVKQQNLTTGSQQVAYVAGPAGSNKVPSSSDDAQLESKVIENVQVAPLFQKSEACCSRQKELSPARPADA